MTRVMGQLMAMGMSAWLLISCATGRHPSAAAEERRFATYANPVDLPYRYQPASNPYREAADPTVVRFHDKYWLFASHSKGYWYSVDLLHWNFVRPTGFPVDLYAPTAIAIDGRLYVAVSQNAPSIWVTDDPEAGVWTEAANIRPGYNDPCLFQDDDGRLYMYEGLSGTDVLHVYELDPHTFQRLNEWDVPQSRNKEMRGWEVVGDNNDRQERRSYVEGSWMTKFGGRYYLQYSAPGTEFKTYADGVLVSDHPMGPFSYQPYSPFSVKPSGFISGAGHSSTFQATDGHWWHASTMTISRRHNFERRLGLFPAQFTEHGELIADTYLGDYPRYIDGDRGLTGWMLLSRHRQVMASSSLAGYPPENAVDEDVRTWWSAASGNAGEWFEVDLGGRKRIEAIQINFADQDSSGHGISADVYRYALEVSDDRRHWTVVVDRSSTGRDAPHDYEVLPRARSARYVRLRNIHSPDGGRFSLYDLRIFGLGEGVVPGQVTQISAMRNATDARKATLSWQPVHDAEFYIVRIGTRPDLLTESHQVYDSQTTLDIASLNAAVNYYATVDAVSENGIRVGVSPVTIK